MPPFPGPGQKLEKITDFLANGHFHCSLTPLITDHMETAWRVLSPGLTR